MLASQWSLPPPSWALRFRSDDLDEVRAFMGSVDVPHSRVGKKPGALGYDFFRVLGAAAAVGRSQVAAAQTVRGWVSDPVLHLTQPTGSVYRVGRRVTAPTSWSSVVVVAPDWEFTRVSPPGTVSAIKINQRALRDELESRRPSARGNWSLSLELLTLTQFEKAALMAATAQIVQATRPGLEPRQLALAEGRVIALVADLLLRESAASPVCSLSISRAIDLEAWIEAHLDEPLSLGRLCRVAGVGARCLQKTFEQRRGMSPMRFVTERRILRAFRRLSQGEPGVSVTSIALDLGFDHLSRFAHIYRQVIGESPSQTLAPRRPADASRLVNSG